MSKLHQEELPATFDYQELAGGEALRKYLHYAGELTREDYMQWYEDEKLTHSVIHVKSFCVVCILLAIHERMLHAQDITVKMAIEQAAKTDGEPVKDPLVRERIQQFSCMFLTRPKEGEEAPTYMRREMNRIYSRLLVGRMLLKWLAEQDNEDLEPWPTYEVPVGSYYAISKNKNCTKMLSKALGDGPAEFAEWNKPKNKTKKEKQQEQEQILQDVANRANALIRDKKLIIVDKDNDVVEEGLRLIVNKDLRK